MSAVVNRAADVGQGQFAIGDRDQTEHGGRIDEWQQVIDLEVEFVGQVGEPDATTVGVDDLDEAGKPADRGSVAGAGRSGWQRLFPGRLPRFPGR